MKLGGVLGSLLLREGELFPFLSFFLFFHYCNNNNSYYYYCCCWLSAVVLLWIIFRVLMAYSEKQVKQSYSTHGILTSKLLRCKTLSHLATIILYFSVTRLYGFRRNCIACLAQNFLSLSCICRFVCRCTGDWLLKDSLQMSAGLGPGMTLIMHRRTRKAIWLQN